MLHIYIYIHTYDHWQSHFSHEILDPQAVIDLSPVFWALVSGKFTAPISIATEEFHTS